MTAPTAAAADEPLVGPDTGTRQRGLVAAPRLVRHEIRLVDGHRVGVAVSGRGVPLVVIHGFSAEGVLYAQTLSRLVSMGFKVIAIDVAGHGSTEALPFGHHLEEYTRLLARALDELGVHRAVVAGHSMGGRIVTQLAASEPERAIAVVLIDAIVGDTWDAMVNAFRVAPPLLVGVGALLVVDTLATVPLLVDPGQARKLGRLVSPTIVGHLRKPWRLVGPAVSILRSRGSRWMLERIAEEEIPLFVLHGDHDLVVPHRTAVAAARRGRGTLVTVKGGTHSWLLRDPETLPAIVGHLLDGPLGAAYRDAISRTGLDPDVARIDDVEAALYQRGARILDLTPELAFDVLTTHHAAPSFEWAIA